MKNTNGERYRIAFGHALREFRNLRVKTQETLAFDIESERTYISALELGQKSPTLTTIVSICEALDISTVALFETIERYANDSRKDHD